jgi:hypothetical protein
MSANDNTGRGRPAIDLANQTVGLLTVVGLAGINKAGCNQWELRCSCGETVYQTTSEIRRSQRDGRQSACHSCARSLAYQRAREALGPVKARNRCVVCYGISDRRPKTGCRGCGEPFAEDVVEYSLPTPGCGLGRVPW